MSDITQSGDLAVRRAARIAGLVGLLAAVLAGVVVSRLISRSSGSPSATGSSPSAPATPAGPAATGPVAIAAPSLAASPAIVCRALLSQLPERLRDLPRRPVTSGAEQNAAYGEPPITLACGVPAPSVPPTAQVYVLSGVCWYSGDGGTGRPSPSTKSTVWTTLDRAVPVAVTVPAKYSPAGQWVIDFSGPIIETVPSAPAPAGCSG